MLKHNIASHHITSHHVCHRFWSGDATDIFAFTAADAALIEGLFLDYAKQNAVVRLWKHVSGVSNRCLLLM